MGNVVERTVTEEGTWPGPLASPAVEKERAQVLAGKVCAAAAIAAQASARLLELLGEFDAVDGFRFYDGCGSTARWLAWSCAMSPGTAREHVRIARALRRMPQLAGLFGQGRVSFSKVRAATRLVGVVEESGLCELALTMTAAQLDATVSAYRASSGSRMPQQERRRVSWSGWPYASTSVDADHVGDDADGVEGQMVCLTARLPVEEAAVVIGAIEAARDRQPVGERDTAEALVEVARDFLAAQPADESGEDRTMVVVHVGAETLLEGAVARPAGPASTDPASTDPASTDPASIDPASIDPASTDTASTDTASTDMPASDMPVTGTAAGGAGDASGVPAGTSKATDDADSSEGDRPSEDGVLPEGGQAWGLREGRGVPAGTPAGAPAETSANVPGVTPGAVQAGMRAGVCAVPGVGPIEPVTAARLACDATVLGAIIDRDGAVLALGRARRLVSKAQRRALMVRDRMCCFPGCHRDRHLQAHHVIPWSEGGRTDLDNLLRLCQRHHTYVHEGGLRLARMPHGWQFLLPDGRDVREIVDRRCASDDFLACYLAHHAQQTEVILAGVTGPDDPVARPLRPGWAGEPFSLHNCVEALFGLADTQQRNDQPVAA